MFSITAQFRPTRSKRDSEKPGVVFFRITGQPDIKGRRDSRVVHFTIPAVGPDVLQKERASILSQLRLLYCIIERRENTKEPFNIDDVADDFRKALSGDVSMREAIAKSQVDFPFRSDLFSLVESSREISSSFFRNRQI